MSIERIRVGYDEAAAHIGIKVGTLRWLVCRRAIPHLRLGPRLVRFDLRTLDAWLAAHNVEVVSGSRTAAPPVLPTSCL